MVRREENVGVWVGGEEDEGMVRVCSKLARFRGPSWTCNWIKLLTFAFGAGVGMIQILISI